MNNIIYLCEPICSIDDKCLICDDIEKNKCLKCSQDFYLDNGKCNSYSFKALYQSKEPNEVISFINGDYFKYIEKMKINNTEISSTNTYNFSSIGEHTIYFLFNISTLNSLEEMFLWNIRLISITFFPKFYTANILSIENMFSFCS